MNLRKIKYWCLIFILSGPIVVKTIYTQNNIQIANFAFDVEVFTLDDGLSANHIISLCIGKNQDIYTLTPYWIEIFNGNSFKKLISIEQIGYTPRKIMMTSGGNLLLLDYKEYYDEILKWNFSHLDILNINTLQVQTIIQKDSLKYITKVTTDSDGDLLISTNKYQFYIEKGDSLSHVNLPGFIQELVELVDYDPTYYLANSDSGILFSNSISDTSHTILENRHAFKKFNSKKDNEIIIFDYDLKTNTEKFNISLFNKNTINIKKLKSSNIDANTDQITIIQDSIIFYGSSIFNYSAPKNNYTIKYASKKSPPNTGYNKTLSDHQGNIWNATFEGLVKLTPSTAPFSKSLFQSSLSVKYFFESKENQLVGSGFNEQFVYSAHKNIIEKFTDQSTWLSGLEKNNQILISNASGYIQYLGPSGRIKTAFNYDTNAYPGFKVNILLNGPGNTIYNISKDGLYSINIDQKTSRKIGLDIDLSQTNIYNATINKEIYIASSDGLIIIDTTHFTSEVFLAEQQVYDINQKLDDTSEYWVATEKGLQSFNKSQNNFDFEKDFGSVLRNTITKIIPFKNYLILPSFDGLLLFDINSKNYSRFTESDGLPNNEFNFLSSQILENGDIALGTIKGITIFSPIDLTQSIPDYSINPQLSEIKYLDHDGNIYDSKKENFIDKKINFPDKSSSQILTFVHKDYQRIKNKTIKYRLSKNENSQNEWITNNDLKIELTRRNHGTYILEIIVLDRSFNEIGQSSYEINYLKPYYLKIWFWILTLILLCGCTWFYVKIKQRKVISQNRKLEAIVKSRSKEIRHQNSILKKMRDEQNHLFSIIAHDLKTPINSMHNLSQKINYLIQTNQIERIGEIGQYLSDKVSKLSHTINGLLKWSQVENHYDPVIPTLNKVEDLFESVSSFVIDLANSKSIELTYNTPGNLYYFADEKAIESTLRNIISNAIKFSFNNSIVHVKGVDLGPQIEISVANKGKYFDPVIFQKIISNKSIISEDGTNGEKGTGIGLQIALRILKENNGTIQLENQKNQTIIKVRLPKQDESGINRLN